MSGSIDFNIYIDLNIGFINFKNKLYKENRLDNFMEP